jgi:hypothetical protein
MSPVNYICISSELIYDKCLMENDAEYIWKLCNSALYNLCTQFLKVQMRTRQATAMELISLTSDSFYFYRRYVNTWRHDS